MAIKENSDPRMRRTRKLLQGALFELLKQKPLSKIQIKEITEVAELSRPTFYKQFDTKEELLFSHVNDVFDQISKDVRLEAQKGEQIDLFTLVTASFKQWKKHRQLLQWVNQVDNKDLVIKALTTQLREIKQVLDQYAPPHDLAHAYEDYLMNFISGGMYMLIKTWLDNDMRESPEKMALLTFILLYNGFSPPLSERLETGDMRSYAIKLLQSPTL